MEKLYIHCITLSLHVFPPKNKHSPISTIYYVNYPVQGHLYIYIFPSPGPNLDQIFYLLVMYLWRLFLRVQDNYLVECYKMWVCQMDPHEYIQVTHFGRNTTEVTYPSQCLISGGTWFEYAPSLVILTLII